MFLLAFSGPPYVSEEFGGVVCAKGFIQAGDDLAEFFLAPLTAWTMEDYLLQWHLAASAVLSGSDKSAFLTYVLSADKGNHVVTWPIYRSEAGSLALQNRLVFDDFPDGPADLDFVARTTQPFSEVSEDGPLISTWVVTVGELSRYVHRP